MLSKKSGFTFIETLVAVGILTIALASPLMLASSSIRLAGLAKDKFIASYLAAEAVEYVKNVRDGNALDSEAESWLDNLGPCLGPNSCEIDVTKAVTRSCGAGCSKIKYDENSGLYQYDNGEETKFTRVAEIEELVQNQEAKITVTVSWDGNNLVIQDNIFNWR